jgi:hypothetical protein
MKEGRKEASIEINKMINDNDGKLLMGMVHPVYGPLRGLNFILDKPNIEEILDVMDSQEVEMTLEDQFKFTEEIKNRDPKNALDLKLKIWTETGLSPMLMILPFELADQAENYPTVVNDILGGIKEVTTNLKFTAPLQAQDAFFYRKGII